MADSKGYSVPVVFADRFYMSEKSLGEISSLGGYKMAEAKDARDLADKIGGTPSVRVLISEYVQVNDLVLDRAPGVKGVISYGAGYDHIDVEAMKRRRVQVCNCRGENAQAVAELTFGLLLSLLRRIKRADLWVREGEWLKAGRALPDWVSGQELWRRTLGVIGLGQIGSRVAKIAKGFDMKIIGYDPFINPALYERWGVEPASFSKVLSRSDVITFHLPLNSATENLIDSRAFAAMKPGTILVNTSRGKVIEEKALLEALKAGRIRGAALDVFATEPLPPGHPLTEMENVVLSPHMGAMSLEAGDRLSDSVARQVRDILEGRPPECLIP
jgi:D-3-phosphoglycerate dehydrogenase / 2-oxoglutarate reductase